jgi:hypothetical protein
MSGSSGSVPTESAGGASEWHGLKVDLEENPVEDQSLAELSSPWPLAVFLGFACSLIGGAPGPDQDALSAGLYVVGFVVGVALWLAIVNLVSRWAAQGQRASLERVSELEKEKVKLAAVRVRLERSEVERQIAEIQGLRDSSDVQGPADANDAGQQS